MHWVTSLSDIICIYQSASPVKVPDRVRICSVVPRKLTQNGDETFESAKKLVVESLLQPRLPRAVVAAERGQGS